MSTARFNVNAQLDSAGGKKKGTVLIDRETNIVTVRPSRSRSTYSVKLDELADLIVKKTLLAGAAEQLSPKRAARRR